MINLFEALRDIGIPTASKSELTQKEMNLIMKPGTVSRCIHEQSAVALVTGGAENAHRMFNNFVITTNQGEPGRMLKGCFPGLGKSFHVACVLKEEATEPFTWPTVADDQIRELIAPMKKYQKIYNGWYWDGLLEPFATELKTRVAQMELRIGHTTNSDVFSSTKFTGSDLARLVSTAAAIRGHRTGNHGLILTTSNTLGHLLSTVQADGTLQGHWLKAEDVQLAIIEDGHELVDQ